MTTMLDRARWWLRLTPVVLGAVAACSGGANNAADAGGGGDGGSDYDVAASDTAASGSDASSSGADADRSPDDATQPPPDDAASDAAAEPPLQGRWHRSVTSELMDTDDTYEFSAGTDSGTVTRTLVYRFPDTAPELAGCVRTRTSRGDWSRQEHTSDGTPQLVVVERSATSETTSCRNAADNAPSSSDGIALTNTTYDIDRLDGALLVLRQAGTTYRYDRVTP